MHRQRPSRVRDSGAARGPEGDPAGSTHRRADAASSAAREASVPRIPASPRMQREGARSSNDAAALSGGGSPGRALLALLLELLADALTLEAREIVDEELAVDVVHLVLNADGEQLLAVTLEDVAVAVLGAHPDLRGALDLIEVSGHREAPFLGRDLAFAREDLRVDEDQRIVAVGRDIDDHEPLVDVDLSRGEA